MITFTLNGKKENYSGNPESTLLKYLRLDKHITSVKDGCSGQATCGACTIEINGKAKLACVIKIKTLEGAEIFTHEGFPEYVKVLFNLLLFILFIYIYLPFYYLLIYFINILYFIVQLTI